MSRVSVDVAVIGGEICGLAAGALLALAGKRVVVVLDGDAITRPLGDRLAPLAPTLWKLPQSGPAAGLFDALALKADARRLLGEPFGLGVVDDPDLRCVLPGNEEALLRELSRCFGAERAHGLASTLATVDPAARAGALVEVGALNEDGFFFEARRARGRVAALGAAGNVDAEDDVVGRLRGDGSGLWPVISQLSAFLQSRQESLVDDDKRGGLARFIAACIVQGGIPGGGGLGPRPVLRELLLGFVTHHKGDVVVDRVEAIELDRKGITLLRTTSKVMTEIVPRVVIDATANRDLADRLPTSRTREKLLVQQARVVASGRSTSVRWLLPLRLLPRGMPPLLLQLSPSPSPPMLVGLFAGAPLEGSGNRSHLDEQLLCVVATSPTDDAELIEQRLMQLIPFARSQVRHSDVVDAFAVHGRFIVKDSEHALQGRRPRTACANLVRAGRDLAPAFGVDGELAAARGVVHVAERVLGRS